MSEHTENIRRAVKIGYDKLVDALDRMEKERDGALEGVERLKYDLEQVEDRARSAKSNYERINESLQKQFSDVSAELRDLKKKAEIRTSPSEGCVSHSFNEKDMGKFE